MHMPEGRRGALRGLGIGLAAFGLVRTASATGTSLEQPGAAHLQALTATLAKAPRRRDFKTVQMVLERREEWDADALDAVLADCHGAASKNWAVVRDIAKATIGRRPPAFR